MRKSRVILILACIMAVTCCFSLSCHALDYTKYAEVKTGQTTSALKVRTGPGTGYGTLGTLPVNTNFTILGYKNKSGDKWYRMTYAKKEAYVSAGYVKLVSKSAYRIYTPHQTGKTSDKLNVRAKASTKSSVIGMLSKGEIFTLKGYITSNQGDTWYAVTYDGKNGYVNGKYVKKISSYSYDIYSPSITGKAGAKGATVRAGAAVEAKKLGLLKSGQKVTLKGYRKDSRNDTWYRIAYGGKAAYVSASVVSKVQNSSGPTYTPSKTLLVGKYGAVVRASASESAKKLGSLNEGTYLKTSGYVTGQSGEKWNKVSYGGKTGYISEKSTSTAGSISWTPYVPNISCTTKDDGVRIRKGPSTGYKVLGSCPQGTQFTIRGYRMSTKGVKWYLVKYKGSFGYVNANLVKKGSTSSVTYYSPYREAEVAGSAVNIRKAPSTSAASYGTLAFGRQVTVRGFISTSSGKWFMITYADKTAYVKASVMKLGSYASLIRYTPYKTAEAGKSGAGIYKNASASAKKIGSLKSGYDITVRGYKKDGKGRTWYRVVYAGQYGWMPASSCSIAGSTDRIIYTPSKYAIAGAYGAAVYASAKTSASKYGTLNDGTIVSIKGYMTDGQGLKWYWIQYGGKNAYVRAKELQLRSKPSFTPYTPYKTGQVKNKTGIAIYKSPSLKADKEGTAVYSTKFTIRGYVKKSDAMFYFVLYNGKNAYLKASDIAIIDTAMYTCYSKNKTGTVNSEAAIRKSPYSTSSKIATVKKGTSFTVFAFRSTDSGRWYRVVYDNKAGYIPAKYVTLGDSVTYIAYTPKKSGVTTETVNLRNSATTDSAKVTVVSSGKTCTVYGYRYNVKGEKWYRIGYGEKRGYIMAKYVDTSTASDFEEYLTKQGFPDSYKAYLRTLHKAHPKWKFVAQKTGLSWSTVVDAETSNIRRNLYNGPYASWRSMEKGAYDFGSGKYVNFDGSGWVAAYSGLTKYYLDPRNFLNDDYIFMFMDQSFDSATQSVDSVKKIVEGTFMEKKFPESSYSSYASCIYSAGKAADINPNVLAAMIIQEQGSSGSSKLISGTVSGYKGYYNFLNIGAYSTGSMSAVTRGLWWAKGAGSGDRSYGRPWNSRAKAIKGGAEFYAEGYINAGQNTLYLKKFNVMNGKSNVGLHQYMTNVQGAAGEASLMRSAYSNINNAAITFAIPVFSEMPSEAVPLPSKSGNNNNLLNSLKVSGYSLDKSFSRYETSYTVKVPSSVGSIKVLATTSDSHATVSGTGTVKLSSGTNTVKVKCKSSSGVTRTYTITVKR